MLTSRNPGTFLSKVPQDFLRPFETARAVGGPVRWVILQCFRKQTFQPDEEIIAKVRPLFRSPGLEKRALTGCFVGGFTRCSV